MSKTGANECDLYPQNSSVIQRVIRNKIKYSLIDLSDICFLFHKFHKYFYPDINLR